MVSIFYDYNIAKTMGYYKYDKLQEFVSLKVRI